VTANSEPGRDRQTCLAVFGIGEGASQDDIEARYRELAYYFRTTGFPPGLDAWAGKQAALLDDAYAVLLDRTGDEPEPAPARRRALRGGLTIGRGWILAGLMLAAVAGAIGFARAGVRGNDASAADVDRTTESVAVDARRSAELLKAVQLDPRNREALFELGEMNFVATQWETAIDWFTQLLSVDPSNLHARTDLGVAQFNLGRVEDARAAWLAALALAPDDPQVNFNLGFLYANTEPQDLAAARNAWQRVIDADPTSRMAKSAQAQLAQTGVDTTGSSK